MPVEIRELIIRAVIEPESRGTQQSAVTNKASDERETIVQECVKQVLRILKKTKER